MTKILHIGLLCIAYSAVFITQNEGLTCFKCNDVASPDHCRDTTTCGQGETCFTEEYINNKGLQAFRLGCEKEARCRYFLKLKEFFGKRDTSIQYPGQRCYNCCLSDECNTKQCHDSVITTPQSTVPPATGKGVTCFNCNGVTSPQNCADWTVCGEDEVCSTEEYTDKRGRVAYRLRCEHQGRCNLLKKPIGLLGKRDLPTLPPHTDCYDCCSHDDCNVNLCTTSPTRNATCNTGSGGCPGRSIAFKDSCYLFAPGAAFHNVGRSYCRHMGADFITLSSQEEHNFLIQEMNKFNASFVPGFWTGAYYSHQAKDWAWLDGSPFNHSLLYPNHRMSIYNYTVDYFAILANPAYSALYKTALLWGPTIDSDTYGVLCKKRNF